MIQYYNRAVNSKNTSVLDKFKTGSWVYCENPSAADTIFLQDKLGIDEGLLLDALDSDEVPRLEVEDGITYIFTRFAYKSGNKVVTSPIMIAISPKYFLSLTLVSCPKLKAFATGNVDNVTTQRPKLLLEVLEVLLESYATQLNGINRQIRGARASLNVKRISNKDFVQFVEIEDVLNEFLGDLIPANSVLQSLAGRRKNLTFYEDDKDLIEDLQLSATQLIDTIRGSLKTAVNIREAYTNISTNNLNRQVKILTTLTVVLTIPTIIGSYFGMNVPVPLMHDPHAFMLILLGTGATAGIVLLIFRRNHWL